jgi:hypothetical protein
VAKEIKEYNFFSNACKMLPLLNTPFEQAESKRPHLRGYAPSANKAPSSVVAPDGSLVQVYPIPD